MSESGWVIEAAGPKYWTGRSFASEAFSSNADDAVRFSREQDASVVLCHCFKDGWWQLLAVREHVWLERLPMPELTRGAIFTAISEERDRQDAKWGVQRHVPVVWAVIAQEECGEVAKAALENDFSSTGYVRELIQLAAVCVSAIESAASGERCAREGCQCSTQYAPEAHHA